MNNRRRMIIQNHISTLQDISDDIEAVRDEEQDCMENLPENLQSSERYERMEEAVDNLDGAVYRLSEAISYMEEAIE